MNANESNSPLIFVVVVVVRNGVVALHKNFLENGTAPIFQFHGSLALSPGRKSPGKITGCLQIYLSFVVVEISNMLFHHL